MTLKLNTASPKFEEHLHALHAAMEHHAGSEERSMFQEAQRLGEARLRELGHALERMLEEQRTSRFQRAFRDLKIRLLEGL
jgi:hemerythrin superfamily protein